MRSKLDMHLFGCCRTVKSFNATLKVLSLNHRFDEIHFFFYEISGKFGVSPDRFSSNLVIKAFCEMDSSGFCLFDDGGYGKGGDYAGCYYIHHTYICILQEQRREIANGLWNLMVIRKCYPNLATFNVRIQHLINKRRRWLAQNLMCKMAVCGISPDELTFNLIIKGFCKVGNLDMAKRIYDSMHSKGCKPNAKIYQTMIHYLCEGGEFGLAFRLCKNSMSRNWFPSTNSICKPLLLLMKNSKDRNAREIMKLV